jgi:methyl-accepting chemotaxis protein
MSEERKENTSEQCDWFVQVDELANQVKMLALNLAINLAKAKNEIRELAYLEPEFTRLINGSVDVIREISTMLNAFRNQDKLVYTVPSGSDKLDRIETSLNEILNLSQNVLKTVADIKRRKGRVDNYRQSRGE